MARMSEIESQLHGMSGYSATKRLIRQTRDYPCTAVTEHGEILLKSNGKYNVPD